jgi:hypothetical protein
MSVCVARGDAAQRPRPDQRKPWGAFARGQERSIEPTPATRVVCSGEAGKFDAAF